MASKPEFDPRRHLVRNPNATNNSKKVAHDSRSKQKKASEGKQEVNNDWVSQENAFFCENVATSGSGTGTSSTRLLGRENSTTRKDFELAQRLQNDIELEDREAEESDLELAKMIQTQEEGEQHAGDVAQSDRNRLRSYNNVTDESADDEYAKILGEEGKDSNGLTGDGSAKREDLEMALIMQNLEALGKGHLLSSINLDSSNNGGNTSLDTMRKLLKEVQDESAGEEVEIEDVIAVNDNVPKKNTTGKKGDNNTMHNFRKGWGNLLRRTGGDNMTSNNGRTNNNTAPNFNMPSLQIPTCSVCGERAAHYLAALDKHFHPSCFRCIGCGKAIPSGESFTFTKNDDGEKFPLHRKCHSTLYGMKCTVCRESIPCKEDGSVSYVKHPFFTSELMCPKHADNPGRRCTSCYRFEPTGPGAFVDLNDRDRCVCHACCRTVIVNSEDAKPLYNSVLHFLEHQLGLPIWDGMHDIPVLIVASDTLNSTSEHSAHLGSNQSLTRGLCLSEHQSGRKFALQRLTFDKNNSSFKLKHGKNSASSFFEVPATTNASSNSTVTAILCLTGLPKDLTASILAHEATHAWLKLHPHFNASKPIPLKVEEGICQLVAYLFLNDGLESPSTVEEDGLSDLKLRQYFKFSIEADENEIYGDGYRAAANIYAAIGIYELLHHIATHRDFPQL